MIKFLTNNYFIAFLLILCALKFIAYPACGVDTGDAFSEAYFVPELRLKELYYMTSSCIGSLAIDLVN